VSSGQVLKKLRTVLDSEISGGRETKYCVWSMWVEQRGVCEGRRGWGMWGVRKGKKGEGREENRNNVSRQGGATVQELHSSHGILEMFKLQPQLLF